jgi:predicted transcriptional regulator/lambda repressor-like predicted transcriptional regulator
MERKPRVVRYTDQQLRCAQLRAKGFSLSRIAAELSKEYGKSFSTAYVSNTLKRFRPVADQIRADYESLRGAHYWEKERLKTQIPMMSVYSKYAIKRVKRLLREGYYPRKLVPFGYQLVDRELIPHAEKVQVVLAICRGRLEGKSVSHLSRQYTLSYEVTVRILTDPIYRQNDPIITWSGKKYRGKHVTGIVPQDVWKNVQSTFATEDSQFHGGYPPFGFKNFLFEVDSQKIEKVKRAFELRADMKAPKTYRQINKDTGIPVSALHWIFTNPIYLKKKIVTREIWDRVQELKADASKFWERMGQTTRTNIITSLTQAGEMTTPEIAQKVNVDVNDVRLRLIKMHKDGYVEKRRAMLRGKKVDIWRLRGGAKERDWFFHDAIDTTVPVEKVKALFQRLLQGPTTARDLSETTGRSRFTVRGWLNQLRMKGILELFQPNKGKWRLKSEYVKTIKEKLNA